MSCLPKTLTPLSDGGGALEPFFQSMGRALPVLPLDIVFRQGYSGTDALLDRCHTGLVGGAEDASPIYGLIASEDIKAGSAITLLRGTHFFRTAPYTPLPMMSIDKMKDLSPTADKEEIEFITKLALFQRHMNEDLQFFHTDVHLSVSKKPATTAMAVNPCYLGNYANEGMQAEAIQLAIDDFLETKCAASGSNGSGKRRTPKDEEIDDLVKHYILLSNPQANVVLNVVLGSAFPALIATKDIKEGETIKYAQGINVWLGKRMLAANFSIGAMTQVLKRVDERTNHNGYLAIIFPPDQKTVSY